jgi:hypothetical protein
MKREKWGKWPNHDDPTTDNMLREQHSSPLISIVIRLKKISRKKQKLSPSPHATKQKK